jgi:SHS family lactate transporter-like MFS transporter
VHLEPGIIFLAASTMADPKKHTAEPLPSEMAVHEQEEGMSAGRYMATRISTLKPPMNKAPNPFKLLALLNFQQWMFFLVAFFAWSWDAFDFFTVSLTVSDLAKDFGKTNKDITWGITLVLMLRSVGSIIFGLAADRWGRKASQGSLHCCLRVFFLTGR